ncbi:MOSC domain-containing protein [Paenibacillus humicola]|uniref:MOSC domain-containing protein n=1 Tax=Paenibacillus humicola TaxID=3110540 RepID=UPI00237B4332|nr:MOSC domain-containing protein [Paenibacillus humicola]
MRLDFLSIPISRCIPQRAKTIESIRQIAEPPLSEESPFFIEQLGGNGSYWCYQRLFGVEELPVANDLEVQAGKVVSVSRSETHSFSKQPVGAIRLIAGLGVEGDAHMGRTVKHRSRVAQNPNQPNHRQVHLIHSELFDELRNAGFHVEPGQMGENITTRGIDILGLPTGAKLTIGESAVIEITGLRNPCSQIDRFQSGLLKEVLDQDENGNLIRKAGIMGVVLSGGEVRVNDPIQVVLPPEPFRSLERV